MRIEITKPAKKDLFKLDEGTRTRILKALKQHSGLSGNVRLKEAQRGREHLATKSRRVAGNP